MVLRCKRRESIRLTGWRPRIPLAILFSLSRWFDDEIIILCVRWYVTYKLSYRDLCEMMADRGLQISHTHSNALGRPVRAAVREEVAHL